MIVTGWSGGGLGRGRRCEHGEHERKLLSTQTNRKKMFRRRRRDMRMESERNFFNFPAVCLVLLIPSRWLRQSTQVETYSAASGSTFLSFAPSGHFPAPPFSISPSRTIQAFTTMILTTGRGAASCEHEKLFNLRLRVCVSSRPSLAPASTVRVFEILLCTEVHRALIISCTRSVHRSAEL